MHPPNTALVLKLLHGEQALTADYFFQDFNGFLHWSMHYVGCVKSGAHDFARTNKVGLPPAPTELLFVREIILPLVFFGLLLMKLIIPTLVFTARFRSGKLPLTFLP